MEKIFVMLRVTEEKERNFEKRGYMGKKVLGIMVILLFFTGCQNMGNESENLQQVEKQENGEERNSSISNDETETNVTHEKDQELSNGEHIRFQLGSQAKIDAVVDMPDKKWNEFEKCMIEVDGFQGESVFNKILGKLPESGLETRKGDMGEPDVCYSYEGILGEQLKNQKGIDLVLAPQTIEEFGIPSNMLPEEVTKIYQNDNYQLIILNSTYEVASDELNAQIGQIDNLVKEYDENSIIAGEGALTKDLVEIADHDFKVVNYLSIGVIFIIMLFVLKSVSLPFILVFAIEMAIFINMAISYYTGTSLPFIASIVIGTIQLGATIDYAILMSTKYIEERSKTKDKKKAMEKTLKLTVPSIITSALCFFCATFGVAIYSQIDMIGSICNLLSRGAIISMLVVILVLPSLILIFDKLIVKTTKNMKEGV